MLNNANLRIHWSWDLDQSRMLKSGRMQGAPFAWNTHTILYFCGVLPLKMEIPLGNMTYTSGGWRNPPPFYDHQTETGSDLQPKLLCPLCRGDIYGWSVVESARQFMNSKVRSCSSETCDFSGTYSELRKHARSAHPLVRPTEVDPERQHDWTRLERERDYEDMLSSIQSVAGEESNGESLSDLEDFRSWLTINLAYLTLALEFISDSRSSDEDSFRRRSGILCQKRDFQVDCVDLGAFSNGGIAVQHQIEFPKGGTKVHKLTEHGVAKVDCDGEHQDGPPIMGSNWSQCLMILAVPDGNKSRRASVVGLGKLPTLIILTAQVSICDQGVKQQLQLNIMVPVLPRSHLLSVTADIVSSSISSSMDAKMLWKYNKL
ncbi:hypothetical protein V6N12_039843 [Hibiscus sabdariffa]|uniref:Uncharacterized protein n=1 Tax=Hibiscus sabdariffa TaxID=183260 RepID=A0ABR2E2A5_9ROSI